jgi:PIN domain nuclease of toxin-antitoxin system
MSVLLDTCIYLWILEGSGRLTEEVRHYLDQAFPRYVSAISFTEIEIERSIGNLTLPDTFRAQLEDTGLTHLEYVKEDSAALSALPFHHKDPFDRMLISQAMARNLPIVTADPVFKEYPVTVKLAA